MGRIRSARQAGLVEQRRFRREKQWGQDGILREEKEPEVILGPLGPRALILLALFFDHILADVAGMLPVEGHRDSRFHSIALCIAHEHPGPGGTLPKEPVAPRKMASRQDGEQDSRFSHSKSLLRRSPPSVNRFFFPFFFPNPTFPST